MSTNRGPKQAKFEEEWRPSSDTLCTPAAIRCYSEMAKRATTLIFFPRGLLGFSTTLQNHIFNIYILSFFVDSKIFMLFCSRVIKRKLSVTLFYAACVQNLDSIQWSSSTSYDFYIQTDNWYTISLFPPKCWAL